jgi:HK97 family phage major capsid protein
MVNSVQLRKEKYDLVKKARAILERAGARDLNTEEDSEYQKMQAAIDDLSKRIERLESLESQEDDVDRDDDEDDRDDEDEKKDEEQAGRSRSKSNIWATPETRTDKRSSKEYQDAFERYLKSGKVNREFRDFTVSGGDGAGSLITPTAISDDFVNFLNSYTFVRNLANVQFVNDAQSLGNPRLKTDIADADWTAEVPDDDIVSDTTGQMDRYDLTPALLTKMESISIRELMLTPKIAPIVMERLAYKFAVSEEKGFLTGDGTTNGQPLGVFHASSSGISTGRDVTASSTTGFNADDLLNMTENIAQQYTLGDSFGWVMSRPAVLKARKLKDGKGDYLYGVSLAAGRPDTLCGYPLYKSEFAPSTFTTGLYVAVLGNFKFYRIAVVGTGAPVIQTLYERYAPKNLVAYIGREWIAGGPVREEAFSRLKLG